MGIEPGNYAIAEIYLIRVTPIGGSMALALILYIISFLAESAEPGKYFVIEEGRHNTIRRAVNQKNRRTDLVQVEDGGVLDISLTELPGRSTLLFFADGNAKNSAGFVHSAVASNQISKPIDNDRCLKPCRLHDQRQGAIRPEAMSHDA